MNIEQLKERIIEVKDFPKPGIGFKDISPLVHDAASYHFAIGKLTAWAKKKKPDVVIGIESRGYLFAAPVAHELRLGLDIIRKAEMLGIESPHGPVSQKPSGLVLYPCVPNPSSGHCLIRYALPGPSLVSLKVYDISGRLVRELDRGGERPAGVHVLGWDGRNGAGLLVPGGVYLYRLEVGGFSRTRSVVLLR